jgi:hypothetical protein
MLHIIVHKLNCDKAATDLVEHFVNTFTNFISEFEILTVNVDPLDLSIVTSSYFPKELSKHIVKDFSQVIVNTLDTTYGKALYYIKELRKQVKAVMKEDYVDPEIIDLENLKPIVEEMLYITASCTSVEEIKAFTKEDSFKTAVVHLFSPETEEYSEIDGVHHFNLNSEKLQSINIDFFRNLVKKIKKNEVKGI